MRNKNSNKAPRRNKPDYIETYRISEPGQLLPFLLAKLAPRSRSEIKSYLAHGNVMLNGRVTTQFDEQLQLDDEVMVNFTRPFVVVRNRMIKIIYEDPDLIVVEKKSGLLSVPNSQTNKTVKTALDIVDQYVNEMDGHSHAYVCHRLDQYTSGILIFAKNPEVQEKFRNDWNVHVVERKYTAICEGYPRKEEGEIRSYLNENNAMRVYSTNNPEEGKLAVTRYKVVKRMGDYCMMDIQILTGRKNQIRVHMKDLGCPIAGDRKYGAQSDPCNRLMLHNHALQFIHPITHENLRFELPLPKEFGG